MNVTVAELPPLGCGRPPTWAALTRRLRGRGCLFDRNRARPGRTRLERRMVHRPHSQTAQREVSTTVPGRWRGAAGAALKPHPCVPWP